jgi:single-strand DNA-binding protein
MLNNITLQGRLTRSPEMKATASGISCATFTLACEQDYKNQNGERDTDFFDVVAWRNTADFVQRYFGKGQMVVVRGRLQTRQWTAEDGSKRKAVQIVAENVYFCGANNASGQDTEQATEQPAAVEESGFTPVETDELPF